MRTSKAHTLLVIGRCLRRPSNGREDDGRGQERDDSAWPGDSSDRDVDGSVSITTVASSACDRLGHHRSEAATCELVGTPAADNTQDVVIIFQRQDIASRRGQRAVGTGHVGVSQTGGESGVRRLLQVVLSMSMPSFRGNSAALASLRDSRSLLPASQRGYLSAIDLTGLAALESRCN